MNAPAQTALAVSRKPGGDPTTPVIVKIGVGGPLPPNAVSKHSIQIEGGSVEFEDPSGVEWKQAASIKTARLAGLQLDDGSLKPLSWTIIPRANALTTLTLSYAPIETELFMIQEVQDGPDGPIKLQLTSSSASFRVIDGSPEAWRQSKAAVSSSPTTVGFVQKSSDREEEDLTFNYSFNFPEITLTLAVQVDE